MTLVKWTPVRNRIRVPYHQYLSSIFDEEREDDIVWHPRMNVSESDKDFIIRMEIPGVSKKDISIKMKDRILNISGERKSEEEQSLRNHICELCNGKFERSLRFHEEVDDSKISATYKDGILTVKVPKAKPSVSREIKID